MAIYRISLIPNDMDNGCYELVSSNERQNNKQFQYNVEVFFKGMSMCYDV